MGAGPHSGRGPVCAPRGPVRLHAEVTSPSFLSVRSLGHAFLSIPNKTQFIIILNTDLYILKKRALSLENGWALG